MARADLSTMLGRLPEPISQVQAQPKAAGEQAPKVAITKRPAPANKEATKAPKAPKRASSKLSAPQGHSHYSQLERKEARLREDQYANLTMHARRLNRAKGTGGERITENTLIRIAIDLLLANIDSLEGTTEDELTNSVTHRVAT